MSIITISRGSYSKGKEIAEKVAQELGYDCIAREVLIEASEEFNVPELKLDRSMSDAPSILDRLSYGKERYIAFIQAAILKHFQRDNVVYHGLAGHFFVKDISHVLKVQIIADLEVRTKNVMDRDKLSREEALRFIENLDNQRRNWSKRLYGIDTWDASLYDLVIHIHNTINDAVDIICKTSRSKDFQTTPESQKTMDDLALAAQVKAALVGVKVGIEVIAQNGVVSVKTEASHAKEKSLIKDMEKIAKNIPGVKEVKTDVVHIKPYSTPYSG